MDDNSSNDNIVEFPDYLFYGMKDGKFDSVYFKKPNGEYLGFYNDGGVILGRFHAELDKNELKRLMIAWLAHNDPDVLKFDDE